MRAVNFFSVLLITSFFITACQPDDNKLNPKISNSRTESQGGSFGLKVGSYGIPIFAAQNLEQIGALVSECSDSDASTRQSVLKGEPVAIKDCNLRVNSELRSNITKERWQITVYSRASDGQILQALGEISSSKNFGTFKKETVQLNYDDKDFQLNLDPQTGSLQITLSASGVTKSQNDSLDFTFGLKAKGQMISENEVIWKFQDISYNFNIQNRPRKFQVLSNDLQLKWKTAHCAEISGVANTADLTSNNSGTIELTPTKATLTGGKSNWSSSPYADCSERTEPIRNFELLFY